MQHFSLQSAGTVCWKAATHAAVRSGIWGSTQAPYRRYCWPKREPARQRRHRQREQRRAADVHRGPGSEEATEDFIDKGCGAGGNGQLGVGDTADRSVRAGAFQAFGQSKVRMVACGSEHTVAVTGDGAVGSWGCCDSSGVMYIRPRVVCVYHIGPRVVCPQP